MVADFVAQVKNWKSIENKRFRRVYWCYSILFTEEELIKIINLKLDHFGIPEGEVSWVVTYGNSGTQEAGISDIFTYPELNLTYGEEFVIKYFDSREDAWAYANGLGHSLWTDHSDGEGGWIVAHDADPSN